MLKRIKHNLFEKYVENINFHLQIDKKKPRLIDGAFFYQSIQDIIQFKRDNINDNLLIASDTFCHILY